MAPLKASLVHDILTLAGGSDFTLALTKDGSVWSWSSNEGLLPESSWHLCGVRISEYWSMRFRAVAARRILVCNDFNCSALAKDGSLWIWADGSGLVHNFDCGVLQNGVVEFRSHFGSSHLDSSSFA